MKTNSSDEGRTRGRLALAAVVMGMTVGTACANRGPTTSRTPTPLGPPPVAALLESPEEIEPPPSAPLESPAVVEPSAPLESPAVVERPAPRLAAAEPWPPPGEVQLAVEATPAHFTGRLCSTDRHISACASHRSKGRPHLLGLATQGGTIAVASVYAGNSWLSPPATRDDQASRVALALFDAGLRRIRETSLAFAGVVTDVDVAAVPGGWVVVGQTAQGVELIWLSQQGKPSGTRAALARAGTPRLVATATGEVLVVHVGERGGRWPVMATLVDPRGATLWSAEVFDGSVEPNFGNQVVADGGFLLARRSNQGVAVARVERDGTVSASHLVGGSTEYPAVDWCGADGRLVWTDFSGKGQIRSATIDRTGQRRGSEHVLGATPDHFNHSPVLCHGAGSLVLLGGYTGGTGVSQHLHLTRVDRERGAQPGAVPVLADRGPNAYTPRLVRLDARRVAVAWISMTADERSQIGLAVVAAPLPDAEGEATVARDR